MWFDLPAITRSTKVLVLTGKSGAGKTELALALDPCDKNLLVRDTDDLRKLSPAHTKIVFDDFNLAKWNAEDVIHVLDVSRVTSVRCRYETVRIQPWVVPLGKRTALERINVIVVPVGWANQTGTRRFNKFVANPRQPVLVLVQVAQGALRGSVCLAPLT